MSKELQHREMLDFILMHLFVIENSEDIINQYIDAIESSGLYDECKIILVCIRYTCDKTLKTILDNFKKFNKIEIINVKHYEDPYDSEIIDHTNISPRKSKDPALTKLGEAESILRLFYDQTLLMKLKNLDCGIFVHSNNISHQTKYNLREVGQSNSLRKILPIKNWINSYKFFMEELKISDKFAYNVIPNFFAFKSKWINFTLEDYLRELHNLSIVDNYDEKFSLKINVPVGENDILTPINNKGEFFKGHEIIGSSRYSVTKIKDQEIYFANDRHAFARFALKVNFLRGPVFK